MMNVLSRTVLTAAALLVTTSVLSAQSLVSDVSDKNCTVSVLAVGAQRTSDVPLKFKEFPQPLSGKTLVSVTRGAREKAGQGFQFTVNQNAVVHLFVMDRGKPNVPAEWKKTGMKAVFIFDKTADFHDAVYTRDVSAGETVIVPAHDGTDGNTFGVPHCCVIVPKE